MAAAAGRGAAAPRARSGAGAAGPRRRRTLLAGAGLANGGGAGGAAALLLLLLGRQRKPAGGGVRAVAQGRCSSHCLQLRAARGLRAAAGPAPPWAARQAAARTAGRGRRTCAAWTPRRRPSARPAPPPSRACTSSRRCAPAGGWQGGARVARGPEAGRNSTDAGAGATGAVPFCEPGAGTRTRKTQLPAAHPVLAVLLRVQQLEDAHERAVREAEPGHRLVRLVHGRIACPLAVRPRPQAAAVPGPALGHGPELAPAARARRADCAQRRGHGSSTRSVPLCDLSASCQRAGVGQRHLRAARASGGLRCARAVTRGWPDVMCGRRPGLEARHLRAGQKPWLQCGVHCLCPSPSSVY
jgi:hypothetical protein